MLALVRAAPVTKQPLSCPALLPIPSDTRDSQHLYCCLCMYIFSISPAPLHSPLFFFAPEIARSYIDKPASSPPRHYPPFSASFFLLLRLQLRKKESPSPPRNISPYTSVSRNREKERRMTALFSLHPAPADPRAARPFFFLYVPTSTALLRHIHVEIAGTRAAKERRTHTSPGETCST